jgi:hypothetical protein
MPCNQTAGRAAFLALMTSTFNLQAHQPIDVGFERNPARSAAVAAARNFDLYSPRLLYSAFRFGGSKYLSVGSLLASAFPSNGSN